MSIDAIVAEVLRTQLLTDEQEQRIRILASAGVPTEAEFQALDQLSTALIEGKVITRSKSGAALF